MRRTPARTCAQISAITLLLAVTATAAVSGAIQTTTSDGRVVNANIYPSTAAVYLTGGPQNEHGPGLVPDGNYYFQVTDPSGATLLSTDAISCRQVVVSGGKIIGVPSDSGTPPTGTVTGCDHQLGTFNAANGEQPVQLMPYTDTPNPGGEYKAWLTPVATYSPDSKNPSCSSSSSNITFGFCDSDSKTDNFKVKATVANVSVCKFDDQNDNSIQDSGEPLLAHWPMTAAGVDNGSVTNTTVNTQTGDNGCVTLAVSTFSNSDGTQTVTLTEGTFGPDWTQTAPVAGACTLTGTTNPADTCSVSGGVISLTLHPGDDANAPNFGNNNPFCDNECAGGGLVVSKTASPAFTRTFKWGITKSVDQTQINTSSSATFNYTVSVTHDGGTDSAWQVTGSIRLSNPTSTDITGVTVTDAVDNGGSCTVDSSFSGTVPAGNHVEVPYTCTYGSAPGSSAGTNTATATWNNGGNNAAGTAAFDFSNATPTIVDGSVTISDTLGGTLGSVSYTDLSPKTFTYPKTFTDPAGTCTSHPNTATFTTNTTSSTGSSSQQVRVCVGADLTVSKTATPSFTYGITKTANQTSPLDTSNPNQTLTYTITVTESGWKVSGNISVTNPNNWESVSVGLNDVLSGFDCTYNSSVTVGPSSTATVPYSCTPTGGGVPSASGTNSVTATWSGAYTPDTSVPASAGFTFASLTVTDTFNGLAPKTLGTITTPAASTTYPDSYSVTAPAGTCTTYQNTASATDGVTTQTAGASVKVCVGVDLVVTKTATPSFTSNITKSVDKTLVEQAGGTVTFNYTVKVTESGWTVAGNISVQNPNNWEDITANLTDALSDSGGVCTITGGGTVTVLRSSTATLPYSCSFGSSPSSASGTNTAKAMWNAATYFTPDGAAPGSAAYTFATYMVTDCFSAKGTACTPNTLGSVTIPPGSATFTYARTVNNTLGGSCQEYDNTATITQTGQQANAAVTVCNTKTGALTMGFWQNKNGQGIITGGGSTGGGCNSGTWLQQYAPFQDLGATATCTQVATYVFNLIKAANASGAAMNAMLKAQMLATALDVYFSTPSLGGNMIGATQPLGGEKIDVTKVCLMIDGSSGTGSCSGSTENTSAAFGGATSGTISFLLTYAASQSNAGGSIWYGQNKTTQGLAKNTFDAINNQVAYIAP